MLILIQRKACITLGKQDQNPQRNMGRGRRQGHQTLWNNSLLEIYWQSIFLSQQRAAVGYLYFLKAPKSMAILKDCFSCMFPFSRDFDTNANNVQINQAKPLWHNYFLCGFKGIKVKQEYVQMRSCILHLMTAQQGQGDTLLWQCWVLARNTPVLHDVHGIPSWESHLHPFVEPCLYFRTDKDWCMLDLFARSVWFSSSSPAKASSCHAAGMKMFYPKPKALCSCDP